MRDERGFRFGESGGRASPLIQFTLLKTTDEEHFLETLCVPAHPLADRQGVSFLFDVSALDRDAPSSLSNPLTLTDYFPLSKRRNDLPVRRVLFGVTHFEVP